MAKFSWNIGKKRPGPAEIRARPARPSPLKFAGRNGPAQFVKPEIYNPEPDYCINNQKVNLEILLKDKYETPAIFSGNNLVIQESSADTI